MLETLDIEILIIFGLFNCLIGGIIYSFLQPYIQSQYIEIIRITLNSVVFKLSNTRKLQDYSLCSNLILFFTIYSISSLCIAKKFYLTNQVIKAVESLDVSFLLMLLYPQIFITLLFNLRECRENNIEYSTLKQWYFKLYQYLNFKFFTMRKFLCYPVIIKSALTSNCDQLNFFIVAFYK